MILDVSKIKYSIRDKKRRLKLPTKLDSTLAHIIGIHLGDGHSDHNSVKNSYSLEYTGHLTDEYGWYFKYIQPTFWKYFHLKGRLYSEIRENSRSVRLNYRSKGLYQFFTYVLDLPPGKKDVWGIPKVVKQGNLEIKRNFLKGVADTDFSLTFLRKDKNVLSKYPRISLSTSNMNLAKELVELIQELGFTTCSRYNFKTKGEDKEYNSNEININGKKNLEKWMKEIGFSSPKHITKYKIWKKCGYCPPYTTLQEREQVLRGERDIKSLKK